MRGPRGKSKQNTSCKQSLMTSHSRVCRTLRSNHVSPQLDDLPPEMLLHICRFLSLPDLLNFLQLNKKFKNLIASTPKVWTNVSLAGLWPSPENMDIFNRIAETGNVEASIKLAQAYLYKEGVEESTSSETYDSLIGGYFVGAESCKPTSIPFSWLFIRPPWSTNGMCRKARTFQRWKEQCLHDKETSSAVLFSMAKVETYMEEPNTRNICDWMGRAADQGLVLAKYLLWKDKIPSEPQDAAHSLEAIRQLREIASLNCLEAQLHLYSEYAKGNHGHLSSYQVTSSFRSFIQSSRYGLDYPAIFRLQQGFTASMRYILVDWLVEVATLKEFSSDTIHLTVQCVDRYLSLRNIPRTKLQLIGITSMLVCARLVEDNIITIREAAWLTDGTYKYEEVVRMMGEVVATLWGNFKHVTILDFLRLFCSLAKANMKCQYVAQYIAELSLLYSDFGSFKISEIAASCFLLARFLTNEDTLWPQKMVEFTGYSMKDLTRCSLSLHKKCFMESPLTDHRDVILTAVKQRYSEETFHNASNVPLKTYSELKGVLCVEEQDKQRRRSCGGCTPSNRKKKEEQFLLLSPSRKPRKRTRAVYIHLDPEVDESQERSATPTQELTNQEIENETKELASDQKLIPPSPQKELNPAQYIENVESTHDTENEVGTSSKRQESKLRSTSRRSKLQDVKNLQRLDTTPRTSPRSLKRKAVES